MFPHRVLIMRHIKVQNLPSSERELTQQEMRVVKQTAGASPRCRGKLSRAFFRTVYLLCWIGALLILSRHAWAATYTVTTVQDTEDPNDGHLSLREAILLANENPGKDTITFDIDNRIFGPPPHTIFVGTGDPAGEALPLIEDSVIVDGTSEPDYVGAPVVVLDGTAAVTDEFGTFPSGLFLFMGAGSEFRGLVIKNFLGSGITLYDSDNLVEGNYIGTDASGTLAEGNGGGLLISAANGNTIIGNVISGNNGWGIFVAGGGFRLGSNNQIWGNFIGIDVNGTGKLGNTTGGVWITGPGNFVGWWNFISNNGGDGVFLQSYWAKGNIVQGNRIGTDKVGTGAMPNAGHGVHISAGATNNTIGGFNYGRPTPIHTINLAPPPPDLPNHAPNIIAFNRGDGVFVEGDSIWNEIRANRIFNNGGLGIDLAPDGVTPNDTLDGDSGPNLLQNFPVLISAVSFAGVTTVKMTLNAPPSTLLTVGFYINDQTDPSGYGEGQWHRKSIALITDPDPEHIFTVTIPGVSVGEYITATATDESGNTSEFSNAVAVVERRRSEDRSEIRQDPGPPERDALFQNRPNPFNPETWIPYQLKESAQVTIRIYDAKGNLVRMIDLGHRAAGFYTDRARAAYWDGRNDSGERVSSGIYFYQIQAGDYSETKKMVIAK